MPGGHGEDADLERIAVDRERDLVAPEVLVDRISAETGRRDADESGDLFPGLGHDVDVAVVERIAKLMLRILRVLRELARVDDVAQRVDRLPIRFRRQCNAQDHTDRYGL